MFFTAGFIERFFNMTSLALVMQVLAINFIVPGFYSVSLGLIRRNRKFRALSLAMFALLVVLLYQVASSVIVTSIAMVVVATEWVRVIVMNWAIAILLNLSLINIFKIMFFITVVTVCACIMVFVVSTIALADYFVVIRSGSRSPVWCGWHRLRAIILCDLSFLSSRQLCIWRNRYPKLPGFCNSK